MFDSWSLRLAWAGLLLVLLAGVPLFLCMPLYADVTTFDLGARNLLRGGVHYRDAYDNGLPGMVWLHAGIRALLGWRSEAIRLVDVLVVAGVVGLLVLWLRALGLSHAALVWTAVVLFGFYFATPEVCHCQRDVWMLLPALGALLLRGRQVTASAAAQASLRGVAARAAAEGFCWGLAVWVKPFVLLPALACWLLAAVLIGRAATRPLRVLAVDAAGLVVGGLLAAAPGVAWLHWSGTWPYFCDTLWGWDADYYRLATTGVLGRTTFLLRQFEPWGWVHLAAVPIAVWALWPVFAPASRAPSPAPSEPRREALLAAFYLAWLAQGNYLQYGYLYHLALAFLLALAVVAGRRWLPGDSPPRWALLTGFLGLALVRHPLADLGRTALWPRCWQEGSTPDLQNRLALSTEPRRPDWVALDQVAAYLKEHPVGDGELTCYSFGTTPLYLQLDVEPSTRFVSGIDDIVTGAPHRAKVVRAELAASRQRYVVTDLQFLAADLRAAGVPQERAAEWAEGHHSVLPDFPRAFRTRYPWTEPIVFRAGPYVVHQDTGTLRRSVRRHSGLGPASWGPRGRGQQPRAVLGLALRRLDVFRLARAGR
jgi:hypothetical protein